MKEHTELDELRRRLSDSHESSAALRARIDALEKEIADMHKRRQAIEAINAYHQYAHDHSLPIAIEGAQALDLYDKSIGGRCSPSDFPELTRFIELRKESDRLMKEITF